MRWGNDGDAGKTDADWFWLIGYLAGKALHNPGGDEKKLAKALKLIERNLDNPSLEVQLESFARELKHGFDMAQAGARDR